MRDAERNEHELNKGDFPSVQAKPEGDVECFERQLYKETVLMYGLQAGGMLKL
jgi:hypothetical protein